MGTTEATKRDPQEGSVGGQEVAGGHYDTARLALRSRGIFLPPRINEETDQLVKYLVVALKEAAQENRRKHQAANDLRGWPVPNGARRRSASYDMSLGVPGPGEITARRARAAAREQLSAEDYVPDPVPRRRRMALGDGTVLTRKRAREAAAEPLRNSGF